MIRIEANKDNKTAVEIDEDMCFLTYPCKHYVIMNDEKILMSGVEIYKLLEKNNIKSKHFEKYKDYKFSLKSLH